MELWNEIVTEKSRNALYELKEEVNFVLIGGWAVWIYTRTVKSKDVDIYIDFNDFFKMQNSFLNKGIAINFNSNLDKYEVRMDEIDIDIYTPNHCKLIVPCEDVFKKKLFKKALKFDVVLPEILLILKLNAQIGRKDSLKGFKDRIDILALINSVNLDKKLLLKFAEEYNVDLRIIRDIISNGRKEYGYFFEDADDLRKLKKLKVELLRKIAV